jgi:hypothetical protein
VAIGGQRRNVYTLYGDVHKVVGERQRVPASSIPPAELPRVRRRRMKGCLMAAQRDEYAAAAWRKSSASADSGACVEVAPWHSFMLVRDSHNRSGGLLRVSKDQWREFLGSIRGESGSG